MTAGETTRPRTWADLIARRPADAAAVVWRGGGWSSLDLLRHAASAASLFDAIAPVGAPIPALVSASARALAMVLGASAVLRPLAPLGTRLTTSELASIVKRLPGTILVADPENEPRATEVAAATGRKLHVVDRSPATGPPMTWSARPGDIALVLHTSGTTGLPKRVDVRQDRLLARSAVNSSLVGFSPGSVYASASGFNHIGGLGMQLVALGAGAAVVPWPRFSVEGWVELGRMGVTHAGLVPTMIERLIETGTLAAASVRVIHYGASPISPATAARILSELPDVEIVQIFGQTEGSPITCLTGADHRRAMADESDRLASVGRPAPGVELKVVAPDEHGIGEIWARGRHLFVCDAEGWLHSGDLGRFDSDGFLYLSDRKGDMIIRGGENIYPVEVEQALERHPLVRESAVVGIADDEWGQAVKAVIVPADPSAPPDPVELGAFVRRSLSGIKVPTAWEIRSELPRSSQGKLLRHRLRD